MHSRSARVGPPCYVSKMIYLLRHGETVWNTERRKQGRLDSPLTALGISQAQTLGALLAGQIEHSTHYRIVSSPLGRAWQTAVIIANELDFPSKNLVMEPRLAELAYGHWEGLTIDQIKERHLASWELRRANRWNVAVPDGESYADVAIRVGAWLSDISEAERLIVVCHGVTSRVIRGLYASLTQEVTLALSEPQDSIFRLSNGQIEELGT